jgi:hypothetical protein
LPELKESPLKKYFHMIEGVNSFIFTKVYKNRCSLQKKCTVVLILTQEWCTADTLPTWGMVYCWVLGVPGQYCAVLLVLVVSEEWSTTDTGCT